MKRVLYIQYTNPGGYPPLEHSSKILADAGWDVLFLGTGSSGADALDFPPHPRIEVRKMPFQTPGIRQKLHYLRFCLWVVTTAFSFRPRWIYASDPFSCPAALVLSFLPGLEVIYHEHDSPAERSSGGVFGMILRARHRLAQRARMCVLPNANRLRRFEELVGPLRASLCVWNCPRRDEATGFVPASEATGFVPASEAAGFVPASEAAGFVPASEPAGFVPTPEIGDCVVVYHGTLVPARVPRSLVHALTLLPERVKLRITGYETVGSKGYPAELTSLAASLGVGHRLEFHGPIPLREELLKSSADAHIGLALTPMQSADANFQGMTGASNKAFDYMACGLALIVSDVPEWRDTFVAPGFGLACNPDDARSVADAILWLASHPAQCLQMGQSGRRKILSDWNYETMFAPVLRLMSGDV